MGTETSLVDSVIVESGIRDSAKKLTADLGTKLAGEIRTRGPTLVAVNAADRAPPVRAKLAALPHLPRVSVSVHEEHFDEPAEARETPFGDSIQSEIRDTLLELGLPISTGGVDVVASGKGFSESATYTGEVVTVSAWAEITATDAKTNAVLFSGREVARAADLSVNIAAETARETVGRALAIRLAESLSDGSPATTTR